MQLSEAVIIMEISLSFNLSGYAMKQFDRSAVKWPACLQYNRVYKHMR